MVIIIFEVSPMAQKGVDGRYYGKSQPFKEESVRNRGYLTTEQAIADYVETLYEIKEVHDAKDSAVIGFGGSLGDMSFKDQILSIGDCILQSKSIQKEA